MKTWIVIPARYASTRFPGKPLVKIGVKTLITHVIDKALSCAHIEQVVVATDDQRIAEEVSKSSARVAMTAPELASGTDRIYAAVQNEDVDVVINLQGDEPLIDPVWIQKLIDMFAEDVNLQMATLAHPLSGDELENKNAVKVVLNQNSEAIYFSRFAIPHSRVQPQVQTESQLSYKHVGIYAFRKSFLKTFCDFGVCDLEKAESLEQLRALYLGAKIKVGVVNEGTQGVDVPDDVAKVLFLMNKKQSGAV